jgi:2-succinyl-6-hydroxy-2,4-cyclohexadiene-1-carboxylate synthase
MQRRHVLALHGFLGSANDWNDVETATPNLTWIKPDLFSSESTVTWQDLNSFDATADKVMTFIPESVAPIFIGYSLGGRVGLHLLEKYADRFTAFVFLSTHVGLSNEAEKADRLQNDLNWNQRLLNDPWDDFLTAWTSQAVFSGDTKINKNKNDFDLQKLSCGLTSLSLAQQKNHQNLLKRHQNKVMWVVGDQDQKFSDLAEELKQKKILSGYERILNSGHRVLFDQPSKVAEIICSI